LGLKSENHLELFEDNYGSRQAEETGPVTYQERSCTQHWIWWPITVCAARTEKVRLCVGSPSCRPCHI